MKAFRARAYAGGRSGRPGIFRGQLLVGEKRHLLTLRLFDAKLDRMLWLQSYDFEKVSAGEMADDLIEELYEAIRYNRR